ncbi:MAG: sensor histidine kinase [Treponemataceae bacterium]
MKEFPTKIRFRYRDLSISKKIYLPNLLIIVLLIVISGVIANTFVFNTLIERITLNTRQSLDIIIQSLDNVLNEIETGASKVASDSSVQSILFKKGVGDSYINLDTAKLEGSIQEKILNLKNFVDSVSVFSMDGRLIGSSSLNLQRKSDRLRLSLSVVRMVTESNGKNIWLDPENSAVFFAAPSSSGISMLRAVRLGNIGDPIGILKVDINENIFSKLYSHLDYGRTGRFIVVNRNGTMIFPEKNDYGLYSEFFRKRYFELFTDADKQGTVTTFGKERFVVISNILERLGWVIIGLVPLNELLDYGGRVTWFIYLIGLICILFELMFSVWIAHSISKPIVALSQSMMDASQGDLQIRVTPVGNDEIGALSRSFNEMVERISVLMDQVYRDQKRQRDLELLALQSQINPHFLYNSLESICALSQLQLNDQAYTLGKALSMFYRGVLSGGQLIVSVDEEVKTLQHYLTVQGIRYRNKLECSYDVAEDVLSQRIIKLSLQPIVENSIYHGLKNVRRQGKIWIFGRKVAESMVEFCVVDNGKGMSKEKIAEVLGSKKETTETRGFGLFSVDQRLKLYFGDEYGLAIESRPDYWTKVRVRIPYIDT